MTAEIAMPATLPAPTVILIHEWWGLNDYARNRARLLAKEGYVALAVKRGAAWAGSRRA